MRNSSRAVTTVLATAALSLMTAQVAPAQHWIQQDDEERTNKSMFRALEDWPAPNEFRAGSGFPGAKYWQQRADYIIETSLDTVNHRVSGTERITYHNNSPDVLRFLWIQLDQRHEARPPRISPRCRRRCSSFSVPPRSTGDMTYPGCNSRLVAA